MGGVASRCGEGIEKMLMPSAGSLAREWTGFPEPEANSLLAVGYVTLQVAGGDAAALAHAFCVQGLGAGVLDRDVEEKRDGEACYSAGATHLRFATAGDATPWPGQFYIWVEDLQRTWAACRSMEGVQVVEEAVCCADERLVDALVLRDPGSSSLFVVNQAPKGYAKMLRDAKLCSDAQGLLCVMDILCHMPRGAAAGIGAFYRQLLSACVATTEDGCRVQFAGGDVVRQTLTFKEVEDAESAMGDACHELCIYVPSAVKFQLVLLKCSRAGCVSAPAGCADTDGRAEAERLGEFHLNSCVDPRPGGGVIPLPFRHVVRSPAHPACPVLLSLEVGSLVGA